MKAHISRVYRFSLALLLLSILPELAFSQNFFRINWVKTYDFNMSDRLYASFPAGDGNFLIAGETTSSKTPGQKILLAKLSPGGDLLWQKAIGANAEYKFISVAESVTSGFFILGIRQTGTGNPLVWVVKTDREGNVIWESSTGGGGIEMIHDIQETSEGGAFLCGSKLVKGNNDTEGWLIKLNKKGTVESQALFGARYIDEAFSAILPDKSSGFFLAGYTSEKIGGAKIPYLVKIDFRGSKVWEKSYPEFQGVLPASLFYSPDGLVVCLAEISGSSSTSPGTKILFFDQNGKVLESVDSPYPLSIGKNSFLAEESGQMVFFTKSGENDDPGTPVNLIRTDSRLNPIWMKTLESTNFIPSSIQQLDKSNYLVLGYTGGESYRQDAYGLSFRDYSGKLIETYVIQKLVANNGMKAEENPTDFRSRTGPAKYDALVEQYSREAVTDLRLMPERQAEIPSKNQGPQTVYTDVSASKPQTGQGISGRYYALLIAVEDYDDPMINDLDKPIRDAGKLFDVLVNEYLFEKADVIFLKNPGREEIISTLDRLEKQLTRSDNLLIFYAGHGYWNETSEKGFWLPSDASKQNTANWIANSTLSDYIRSIPAKHTLLIADACFSGSIFKTRAAFSGQDLSAIKLYELTSRKAMTSGTLTEVPDKSVFIEFLVKRLYENQENYLPSEQLFFSFKPAVVNNTESIPQYGVVGSAGDEGGDFIFVRRKK